MKPSAILPSLSGLALLAAPLGAHAQEPFVTGPTFQQNSVSTDRFDAAFDYTVPVWPMYPLFRNQTGDARFDAIVCNQESELRGAVRLTGSNTMGVLKPGECTMFANFANLEFSRLDGEYEWTARIYLRTHQGG